MITCGIPALNVIIFNNINMLRYIKFIKLIHRGNANQASITLKELFTFQIAIPPTLEEQQAIAQVLTNMDDEITALQEKIEKAKQVKQGAMQELLTGKRRLV